MNDKIIKCEIKASRFFFPKGNPIVVDAGDYAILVGEVTKALDNCDDFNDDMFDFNYDIKLKGVLHCEVSLGNTYAVTCKMADSHAKFGDTYEILSIYEHIDFSNKSVQKKFLENILNPELVAKLFEEYNDVVSLLENEDVESLVKIKGIGTVVANKMIATYFELKDQSKIYTELADLKLTPAMITKLITHYTSADIVVRRIQENPYQIVEVSGIGFKKADEIARRMGISETDPRRIKAVLIHILDENGENGRSYLHYGELINELYQLIGGVDESILNEVAFNLIEANEVVLTNNNECVGLTRYYNLEKCIYHHLMRLYNANTSVEEEDFDEKLKVIETEQGFEFTVEQVETIKMGMRESVLAVTGGAGSGKTSTLNGVVRMLENLMLDACALSGKASVRITEATGLTASTIHRLIGFGEMEANERNPLQTDGVILDEATMVNGTIFLKLLKAIPTGAKLFIVGDWQQLTPIGNCQVFTDILNAGVLPISKLTKLHRQAEASGIINLSLDVIQQKEIFNSNYEGSKIVGQLEDMELDIYTDLESPSDKVVSHFLTHYKKSNNLMETQVVSPTKTRGDLCTFNLNNKIQKLVNPITGFDDFIEVNVDKERVYKIKVGDKVLNNKNNYKTKDVKGCKSPVFNGNMGIVKSIEPKRCIIDFIGIGEIIFEKKDYKCLELGYAITVHKGQGSGFDVVIVAIENAAYILLNAELLYTALTRAKKYCILVAQNYAIQTAISKREVKNKQTYLKDMLLFKQEVSEEIDTIETVSDDSDDLPPWDIDSEMPF